MRVIARRLLFYIVTAILAVTVTFFIPRLMPGNPVEAVKMQSPQHSQKSGGASRRARQWSATERAAVQWGGAYSYGPAAASDP